MFRKIENIVGASTDNPVELAKIAGCDPKVFFRGATFNGVDLKGLDLRGVDLTGANFEGVIADLTTLADDEYLRKIRTCALLFLVDEAAFLVTEENFYTEYFDALHTIRGLAEAGDIDLPSYITKYLQDGGVSFHALKIAESVRFLTSLPHQREGSVRTRLAVDARVEGNVPPCDRALIECVYAETMHEPAGYKITWNDLNVDLTFPESFTAERMVLRVVVAPVAITTRTLEVVVRFGVSDGEIRDLEVVKTS